MFGRPGHAYVYFTYGMHFCMNVVTGAQRHPSAVLLRALEPIDGIQLMRRRRGVLDAAALARGPGNLARAFGISRRHDGLDLTEGALWVSRAPALRQGLRVAAGPRIGIRRARTREWRFFLAGHPCVSGPRRGGARRGGAAGPGARPRDRR